jgi:hypothetical protein
MSHNILEEKKTKSNKKWKTTYGLSIYKWNKMYDLQKGHCAICNIHQSQLSKLLDVDLCHKTNKFRDLLCDKCNSTVGYVENCSDIKVILKYIKKHRNKLN